MVPEFLVCFKTLNRIAEEYGLKPIMRMNFHEYYSESLASQANVRTLEKMVMGKPEV